MSLISDCRYGGGEWNRQNFVIRNLESINVISDYCDCPSWYFICRGPPSHNFTADVSHTKFAADVSHTKFAVVIFLPCHISCRGFLHNFWNNFPCHGPPFDFLATVSRAIYSAGHSLSGHSPPCDRVSCGVIIIDVICIIVILCYIIKLISIDTHFY